MTQVLLQHLMKNPKGDLRLDAKASYKDGKAVLTVYGFLHNGRFNERAILQRIAVSRDMPKAEKYETLLALCNLVSVQYECGYRLRSKLPIAGEKK